MSPSASHWFKEQKPRSGDMGRMQDVTNTNITSRFKEGVVAGIKTGLHIANLDNSGPKNTITGTATETFNVAGLTIVLATGTSSLVTVTLTGSGQTAAQVADQINLQAGAHVIAATDGAGKLTISALTASEFFQIFPSSTALTVLGLSGLAVPINIAIEQYKITQGLAFDINGERVAVESDSPFIASNVSLVDAQTPPEPTPKSTGNTSMLFAKGVGNLSIDTFLCIKYLQTTDTSVLPTVVPGFRYEYPSRTDGYQLLVLGSAGDVTTALASGAQFVGFIRRSNGGTDDGQVSAIYPIGSSTPTFSRPLFSVDISYHAANANAHHSKAHQHSSTDGSALTENGAVLIGQSATPFHTALTAAVTTGAKWFGSFFSDPSLSGADGTVASLGIFYNSTLNQFRSWNGSTYSIISSAIARPDTVLVGGQNFAAGLSYDLSNGVTVDSAVITDRFALLPNNVSTGSLGPIASPGGPGAPDAILVRQLRTGERLSVNGKQVSALVGLTLGSDGVYPSLSLYVLNLTSADTGTLYITVRDDGSLSKSTAIPKDQFVIGSVVASSGKVTGGTAGFTDLRSFGSVAAGNLQDLSVPTRAIELGAISNPLMAVDAVDTANLVDASVTVPKLGVDVAALLAAIIPTGVALPYTSTAPIVPVVGGVALAHGQEVGRTDPIYANYFASLGGIPIWGPGNGSTTFNMPNFQGLTLRGVNNAMADAFADPDKASRIARYPGTGAATGNNVGSYQLDMFASHNHTTMATNGRTGQTGVGGYLMDGTYAPTYPGAPVGGATPVPPLGAETRMKNAYVEWLVKL